MELDHEEEINKVLGLAKEVLSENDIDMGKDTWTIIQPFKNGQAITLNLNDDDGERTLKVLVNDATVVLPTIDGNLNIFTTEEEHQ